MNFHLRKCRHAMRPPFPEGLSPMRPKLCDGFFPSVCACAFGAGEDNRPSCRICCQMLDHDWNCMSFLSNIVQLNTVQLLSTDSTLPLLLSTLAFLPPGSEVARPHCLINMTFGGSLFRTFSCSYIANTVWSWTESCNFDLCKPSRTISVGISLAATRAWSHLVEILSVIILQAYIGKIW